MRWIIPCCLIMLFSGCFSGTTEKQPASADGIDSIASAIPPEPTTVSIEGEAFHINGEPTYPGRTWQGNKIEGLLMNARLVQGIFDDLNPDSATQWAYPDTGEWDPERNTDEFVAAMPDWKAHGLLSFTINLQGGSPMGYGNRDWYNSAFYEDGSLREDYMARLKKILDKADELDMAPMVGIFYFGQDENLADDGAVKTALSNAINWMHEQGYQNILIEVANECDNRKYDRDIIKADRVHELITLAQGIEHNGVRYPVSVSYNGGSLPREKVVSTADYILIHGNGVNDPARITEMVEAIRAMPAYRPMPIVFNEDDHYDYNQEENNFVNAIEAYASWGYFDFRRGEEGFEEGFQSVPVDWRISSDRKKEFFDKVKEITGY